MTTDDALAQTLRSAGRAGVYRLPPGGTAQIGRTARKTGFTVFTADLADCGDKEELLARLAQALHFPDWFGHNWDALSDCLADMSWAPAPGYAVVLKRVDHLRRAAAPDFATALEIFAEASASWGADDVPMWVFVDLEGGRDPHLRDWPPAPGAD